MCSLIFVHENFSYLYDPILYGACNSSKVPLLCEHISNIYGHIVNAVCEQKTTFIPNNSKTWKHFSVQKSFHRFIAYPKHKKISIRLTVIQLLKMILIHLANIHDFLFRLQLSNLSLYAFFNIKLKYKLYEIIWVHFH